MTGTETTIDFGNLAQGSLLLLGPILLMVALFLTIGRCVLDYWPQKWPLTGLGVIMAAFIVTFVFSILWYDTLTTGDPSFMDDHFPVVHQENEDKDEDGPVRFEPAEGTF